MRSARLTLGVAAAVIALAGITTAAIRRGGSDAPLRQPEITWEQTKAAITVRIHNVNKHWGLRNQHVRIRLYEQPSNPFNTFGPDGYDGTEEFPELGDIYCCLISELRPGGGYAIELFPSKRFKVNAVKIDVIGPPGWIKT